MSILKNLRKWNVDDQETEDAAQPSIVTQPGTPSSPNGKQLPASPELVSKPWSRRNWPRQKLREKWPYLTLQQLDMLKEVFDVFDPEGKGYFTRDELYFVMTSMGGEPDKEELYAVLYEMDSNDDQVVDFPEFLAKFYAVINDKELGNVFQSLSIQSGEEEESERFVTISVLERCFAYVGDPLSEADMKYLRVIFELADKDGNGKLDLAEFMTYVDNLDEDVLSKAASVLKDEADDSTENRRRMLRREHKDSQRTRERPNKAGAHLSENANGSSARLGSGFELETASSPQGHHPINESEIRPSTPDVSTPPHAPQTTPASSNPFAPRPSGRVVTVNNFAHNSNPFTDGHPSSTSNLPPAPSLPSLEPGTGHVANETSAATVASRPATPTQVELVSVSSPPPS